MLKLLWPLDGFAGSGDYWHVLFAMHLIHNLGMKAVSRDMSLFFRRARGQVTVVLESYVDDTLACRDC